MPEPLWAGDAVEAEQGDEGVEVGTRARVDVVLVRQQVVVDLRLGNGLGHGVEDLAHRRADTEVQIGLG